MKKDNNLIIKKKEEEECPAHKCKPFMALCYLTSLFLILGIVSFVKYLFN